MSKVKKLLDRLLTGTSDDSFRFEEIVSLLKRFGFEVRVKGSHHIFVREGIPEILNLQPRNGQAKPYQVKQVRQLIVKYQLATELKKEDSDS